MNCIDCGRPINAKAANASTRPASTRRQPAADVVKFATFALKCAHLIHGRTGGFDPPPLRWYEPEERPSADAYVARVRHQVNVSLAHPTDRSALAATMAHEVRHLEQAEDGTWDFGDDYCESWAGHAGEAWGPAIEMAWTKSGGELSRIYARKDGPPWYDLPRGAVVLHRGRAYTRDPFRNGPAWAGSR